MKIDKSNLEGVEAQLARTAITQFKHGKSAGNREQMELIFRTILWLHRMKVYAELGTAGVALPISVIGDAENPEPGNQSVDGKGKPNP